MKQNEIDRLWDLWWEWAEDLGGYLECADKFAKSQGRVMHPDAMKLGLGEKVMLDLPNLLLEVDRDAFEWLTPKELMTAQFSLEELYDAAVTQVHKYGYILRIEPIFYADMPWDKFQIKVQASAYDVKKIPVMSGCVTGVGGDHDAVPTGEFVDQFDLVTYAKSERETYFKATVAAIDALLRRLEAHGDTVTPEEAPESSEGAV
jgi:hypothetical protein